MNERGSRRRTVAQGLCVDAVVCFITGVERAQLLFHRRVLVASV